MPVISAARTPSRLSSTARSTSSSKSSSAGTFFVSMPNAYPRIARRRLGGYRHFQIALEEAENVSPSRIGGVAVVAFGTAIVHERMLAVRVDVNFGRLS